jgi:hypothetical protein
MDGALHETNACVSKTVTICIPMEQNEDQHPCIGGFTARNWFPFIGSSLLDRQTMKRRKATWIGHILLKYCHLYFVTEGKIEKRGKGRKEEEEDDWITLRIREDTGS